MSETENAVNEMYRSMEKVARNGGYRERKELLEAINNLLWFDNFGYECYQNRLNLMRIINERGIKNEDIPDYLRQEMEDLDML